MFEFHLFTTEISSKTDTWTEIADEEKNPHFEEWNTENKCQIKFGYFIKKSHVKKGQQMASPKRPSFDYAMTKLFVQDRVGKYIV